ncbi:LysR substrate-binding domain-containing protein [Variovorax sp. Sphag1AA]|uniref:LysR substrate-binding domain-containing protein n=1 Tax=Variovorax sp. Sphag1AA TaxID=2587027 RepID=UPI00160DBB9C|nr:LysR substrate-binding domain-containing protein [Variovorax sp. Sphag1AA]MBB3178188.1 DNA-binding transcriptional LysR family regulator [Variovorax sp. Sphag1AA]
MELRHLRYFVAVAEELNFTRAAERLHIAQPPLSMQIRALEEELKVRLFERDKRRVFLTQAGRHFLDRARAILEQVDLAKGEARSADSGEIGRIALGYTASSMLSLVLPAALRRFREEQPQVVLTLREMTSLDQLAAVHDRALDIGILRRPDVVIPEDLAMEEWHQSPLIAAIPRGHRLSDGPIRLADLRDEPLIMYPRDAGIGLYWKVHDLCAKAGFRPQMVQEARDASTIVGLVAAGAGIALVPGDTRCIQLQGAVYQPVRDKGAVSSLWLVRRVSDPSPFTALMIGMLRAERKRAASPKTARATVR